MCNCFVRFTFIVIDITPGTEKCSDKEYRKLFYEYLSEVVVVRSLLRDNQSNS
jgi:hypothetical protein